MWWVGRNKVITCCSIGIPVLMMSCLCATAPDYINTGPAWMEGTLTPNQYFVRICENKLAQCIPLPLEQCGVYPEPEIEPISPRTSCIICRPPSGWAYVALWPSAGCPRSGACPSPVSQNKNCEPSHGTTETLIAARAEDSHTSRHVSNYVSELLTCCYSPFVDLGNI